MSVSLYASKLSNGFKKNQGCPAKTFPGQLSTNEVSMSKGICPKTVLVKKAGYFGNNSACIFSASTDASITSYMLLRAFTRLPGENFLRKRQFSLIYG